MASSDANGEARSGPNGPVPQRSLARSHAREDLAAISRRPRVSWPLGLALALAFAAITMPTITLDRWLGRIASIDVAAGQPAPITVRVPALAGLQTGDQRLMSGGIVIARGDIASADDVVHVSAVRAAIPGGALPSAALFLITFAIAALFSRHLTRSTHGRLLRVQLVSLVGVAVIAIGVKLLLLSTTLSMLVIPVALLSLVGTMALDRIVGIATGVLAALVVGLLGPFDVGSALVLLVQAVTAGIVVAEQPKDRWRAALGAGLIATACSLLAYLLLGYLTTGALPTLRDPINSPWFAVLVGPLLATLLAVPLLPIYQRLVGEITRSKLVELEELSQPLLKQIADKAPGTWQHSLMMANLAEVAANAIGANGRLVRVGAYYHDLGKALQPKYFIENLPPGETSPHDQLPPEMSTEAIFAHVTQGVACARKAGLHERIVDFMHMHHGQGVLEYFWGKAQEQGNPHGLSIENFRYPGHPPQSRETAVLAICDAVEAASRTLKKPDAASIDALVQRIVYGKLHLGQLDESGLSMRDLRLISDSLEDTIRNANHGRIEYPWQKAAQDGSAQDGSAQDGSAQDGSARDGSAQTAPRLDSLDRKPDGKAATAHANVTTDDALVATQRVEAPVELRRKTSESAHQTVELSRTSPTTALPLADKAGAPAERASASASWTEHGASAAPWPELRGEPSEAVRAPSMVESSRGTRAPRSPTSPADAITPAQFEAVAPAARKRAATLPPTHLGRAPTVPPLSRRQPTIPPSTPLDLGERWSGQPTAKQRPPATILDEDAPESAYTDATVANFARISDPNMRQSSNHVTFGDDARETLPIDGDDAGITAPNLPVAADRARTNPAMHRDLPLDLVPHRPSSPSGTSLASRIDAQTDEWGRETPVRAPTSAELRSLLGQPDPTRQQSLEEIERLHANARDVETPEVDILVEPPPPRTLASRGGAARHTATRRPPVATAEVDPEDIEAAIEIHPPAKRPSSIGIAKPKKD